MDFAGCVRDTAGVNLLIRLIPPFMVRFFAGPYVAGDSLEKGMNVAAKIWARRGLTTTLDLLAEDIETDAVARRNVDTYLQMVDTVAADTRLGDGLDRPTVSLKLSSYTADPMDAGGRAESSREAAFEIAERAKEKGVRLSIDMEGASWTSYTLEILNELARAGHDHVGAVLQSRLHRTEADLERLPAKCRVRMVIGIYQEPSEIAVTDKREMKERLLRFAERLLQAGHYVELATHDDQVIRRFLGDVVPRVGVGTDRYEIQMLYGVPRPKLLAALRKEGVRARLYVPFALSWPMAIAYLRRRLDEYPAMMFIVLKNLVWRR